MNACFFINGKKYPALLIENCFVIGLPVEEFGEEVTVKMVRFDYKKMLAFLTEAR